MNLEEAATHTVDALVAAKNGDPIGAARHAVDALLAVIPVEEARKLLDDAAVKRANAIADIAEEAKFTTFPALEALEPSEP